MPVTTYLNYTHGFEIKSTAMSDYPFHLFQHPGFDAACLQQRPFVAQVRSHADNARRYVPGAALEQAMEAAIALGIPLLLTGDAGSGKTLAAYYAAHRLGLEPVLHFQVKSHSCARDLLYHFDESRYTCDLKTAAKAAAKSAYLTPGPLWQAMAAKTPRVVLIDEIDKAARDFANDLLHEVEKMDFTIPELGKSFSAAPGRRPLMFITSNSECLLPDPFLRRCFHHHLTLDRALADAVVAQHQADFARLSSERVQMAIARFFALREQDLIKPPGLAELLAWLRLLDLAAEAESLPDALGKLPFLGALVKHAEDLELLYEKN